MTLMNPLKERLGVKFYERAEFKQLNAKWRKKLSRSFNDIEDEKENLKDHNRRSQLFDNRDLVLEFFLALDDFLNQADIPKKHRRVLEMYSSGMHKKEISAHVQMSYAWVRLVIDKYELLILSTY